MIARIRLNYTSSMWQTFKPGAIHTFTSLKPIAKEEEHIVAYGSDENHVDHEVLFLINNEWFNDNRYNYKCFVIAVLKGGSSASSVADVKVDDESVVDENRVANIVLPDSVLDVKVGGESVVDDNHVANIVLPSGGGSGMKHYVSGALGSSTNTTSLLLYADRNETYKYIHATALCNFWGDDTTPVNLLAYIPSNTWKYYRSNGTLVDMYYQMTPIITTEANDHFLEFGYDVGYNGKGTDCRLNMRFWGRTKDGVFNTRDIYFEHADSTKGFLVTYDRPFVSVNSEMTAPYNFGNLTFVTDYELIES